MRKQLRFIYRYITAPYRRRKWLNAQTLAVFLVLVLFLVVLALSKSPNWPGQRNTPTRQSALVSESTAQGGDLTATPGPTPRPTFPPEYLTNSEQTISITVVGAFLVLIVVMGVLIFMPREKR